MKTINTLTATLLMALSLNAFAGNTSSEKSDDRLKNLIPTSPFVWGNPDEAVPEGIGFIKAKYALVPTAPFVWGNPEEIPTGLQNAKDNYHNVPNAPFVWGNPDHQAPELLKFIIALNADVPVAPFIWGNANDKAPEIL